jgi:hypothetical protein
MTVAGERKGIAPDYVFEGVAEEQVKEKHGIGSGPRGSADPRRESFRW